MDLQDESRLGCNPYKLGVKGWDGKILVSVIFVSTDLMAPGNKVSFTRFVFTLVIDMMLCFITETLTLSVSLLLLLVTVSLLCSTKKEHIINWGGFFFPSEALSEG